MLDSRLIKSFKKILGKKSLKGIHMHYLAVAQLL